MLSRVILSVTLFSAFNALAGELPVEPAQELSPFSCSDMASDGGYSVSFAADGKSAEVIENSIAGERVVANLTCGERQPARCCDIPSSTTCVDEESKMANDTGYSATITSGGFFSLTQVSLRRGRALLDHIRCR